MIWIPILAIPLALSLVKLGAAAAMASVFKVALLVALALLVASLCVLGWTLRGKLRGLVT